MRYLVLAMLLFASCAEPVIEPIDAAPEPPQARPVKVECLPPNAMVLGRCCLDEDANGICDVDEAEAEPEPVPARNVSPVILGGADLLAPGDLAEFPGNLGDEVTIVLDGSGAGFGASVTLQNWLMTRGIDARVSLQPVSGDLIIIGEACGLAQELFGNCPQLVEGQGQVRMGRDGRIVVGMLGDTVVTAQRVSELVARNRLLLRNSSIYVET